MSSNMKDARWELGYKRFPEIAGVEWDVLSYPEQQRLLDAAQTLIYHMSDEQVAYFALAFQEADDE